MNDKLKSREMDALFDAIMTLQTREECYAFFEDICTIKELMDLKQRYEVAGMLRDGCTYQRIAERTGASTATIGRVNRCLQFGNDGYEMTYLRRQAESGED